MSLPSFDRLQQLTLQRPPPWEEILGELPDALLPVITTIPVGKGIAGVAAESKKPVQLCNLQTDISGVARPGAKQTNVQGSIAVPVLRAGKLLAVYGVAKPHAHDFTAEDEAQFQIAAQHIAGGISSAV